MKTFSSWLGKSANLVILYRDPFLLTIMWKHLIFRKAIELFFLLLYVPRYPTLLLSSSFCFHNDVAYFSELWLMCPHVYLDSNFLKWNCQSKSNDHSEEDEKDKAIIEKNVCKIHLIKVLHIQNIQRTLQNSTGQ